MSLAFGVKSSVLSETENRETHLHLACMQCGPFWHWSSMSDALQTPANQDTIAHVIAG